MFFKRKKEKKIKIYSPLNAELIPLERVPDPVFSQKMMGEGFAFIPRNGEVVSPIDGTVTHVFPTKHAIGMQTEDGVEVFLHIGLDTVELNGEGFEINVRAGDKVRVNDSFGSFDPAFIQEKGKEIVTVLLFPNHAEKIAEMLPNITDRVEAGAEIAELTIK